jgi:hypothetical protein
MTEWPREVFIDINPDVRIRYGRSEQIPIRYAIVLETRVESEWTAVRLWDNAHYVEEHHEHEYTRRSGKRDPVVRRFMSINEAMADAMRRAAEDWPAMVETWRTR